MKIILSLFFFVPFFAHAQIASIQQLFGSYALGGIAADLIILTASIALLLFFWGIAKFIRAAGDEKAIAEGRRFMFWSVIALFVMASLVGIISFLQDASFGGSPVQWLPLNPNP